MKFGFVVITGKPNAGKSTLINRLVKNKISIISHRKNTTRNQIEAIYNDNEAQIIFWDTPGFLKSKSLFDEKSNSKILESISNADLALFLIPYWQKIDLEYVKKINLLENKIKKIAVLTKIDLAKDKRSIYDSAKEIGKLNIFTEIVPISVKKNKNIDTLLKVIKSYLNESQNIYYYTNEDNNFLSNNQDFFITEIIREKILKNFHDELPYRVYSKIIKKEIKSNLHYYECEIIVDDEKIKKILIGNKGTKIKKIGEQARKELEKKYNKKIFLNLHVKTEKNWQNNKEIINNI